MSRPAKSPHLAIFEGNPGKRAPRNLPKFESGDISEAPEWLDDFAREQWAEIAPDLHRNGLLTAPDLPLFASWCAAFSDLRRACIGIEGALNDIEVSAWARVKKSATETMIRVGRKFGLDPLSRNSFDVPGAKPEPDEFDLI